MSHNPAATAFARFAAFALALSLAAVGAALAQPAPAYGAEAAA